MALFSRKDSKAKKAAKEEEKKAAAEAKAAAASNKTPQRGRNGRILQLAQAASGPEVHDIPVPLQPPRHFDASADVPHRSEYGTNKGFEGSGEEPDHYGKHDYHDPYSSGDSGYTSGPGSTAPSRAPSTHMLRQDRAQLTAGRKLTPHLTLGDDFTGEPALSEHPVLDENAIDRHRTGGTLKASKSLEAIRKLARINHETGLQRSFPPQQQSHQDARHQRQVQQSMPMRPSSVPPQGLQCRAERVSRSLPQRSSSPGPILQGGYAVQSPRSRSSVPFGRGQNMQASPFHPRSPTSPTAQDSRANLDKDTYTPSLNILNGLKVNKRGLILDEEGDPIGELYEGDIIDCVRQKADGFGDVLDEYSRVVGRVRTLPSGHLTHLLRPTTPTPSDVEQYQYQPPVPTVPSEHLAKGSYRANDDRTATMQQPMRASQQENSLRDGPVSPTRSKSVSRHREAAEQEDYLGMRQTQHLQEQPHKYNKEQSMDQQELPAHRLQTLSGSMRRSESLPSVPESHSTAEVALSDDASTVSERSQQSTIEEPTSTCDDSATHEQATGNGQAKAGPEQGPVPPLADSLLSVNRSVSGRGPPSRNLSELKKQGLSSSGALAQAQPISLHATPNRIKSPPLPSFPGRGISGMSGGSPFAGGPTPGMPARRLTTPGFPMPPSLGMNGSNAPPLKFRASDTTPLVRSPLSSQETSPPNSEQGSAQGDNKSAFVQPQGHSRSRSVRTANIATSTPAGTRRKFGHASQPVAEKQTDIVVKELGDDKKTEKKKKGMKGLFGRKK